MSWPTDGKPRFKPGSIGNGATHEANPKPQGYVYDRAYGHRIVVALTSSTRPIALARAEAEAAYLNEDHSRDPRPVFWPRLPSEHNATGYERGGCRCETCTAAYTARRHTSRHKKQSEAGRAGVA